MKLDIAAAAARRAQFARRNVVSGVQRDPEPVTAAGFAVVLHPDPEPRRKAAPVDGHHAKPADIARVGKRRVHEVARDFRASQMAGRGGAVVEHVHMSPELAMLASAVSAKIDELPRVADY